MNDLFAVAPNLSQAAGPMRTATLPHGGPHPGMQKTSYQEAALLARQSTISLTTSEGDRVTISADWSSAHTLGLQQAAKGGVMLSSYSLTTLEQQTYTINVQGDLNEDELRDIERLVGELSAIAYDFFSGDHEKAISGALNLGELGTISQLSATFLEVGYSSQRYSSQGPQAIGHLPPPTGSFAAAGEKLPEIDQAYRYHDIVKAQWQQLKEWLEEKTAAAGSPAAPEEPATNRAPGPSERMLEAIRETMSRHPRLTPLSRALAESAVAGAEARFSKDHPDAPPAPAAKEQLLASLGRRLDHWLLT